MKNVPMQVVAGLALLGAVGFLTWHRYASDPEDDAWLDPCQPPAQVALPLAPGVHGSGSPMSCNVGFRSRCYPDVMASLAAAVSGSV